MIGYNYLSTNQIRENELTRNQINHQKRTYYHIKIFLLNKRFNKASSIGWDKNQDYVSLFSQNCLIQKKLM